MNEILLFLMNNWVMVVVILLLLTLSRYVLKNILRWLIIIAIGVWIATQFFGLNLSFNEEGETKLAELKEVLKTEVTQFEIVAHEDGMMMTTQNLQIISYQKEQKAVFVYKEKEVLTLPFRELTKWLPQEVVEKLTTFEQTLEKK